MNKKVLTVLQIVIPVVTIAGVAAVEGFYYATQRCTDEVPDTTSLYVYTVEHEFGELNQRYAKAMGIEPKAKDRLITYDSIPEISSWNEVKDIYIFSHGYSLEHAGRLTFEFDETEPGKYIYKEIFLKGWGESVENIKYFRFLEEMGIKVVCYINYPGTCWVYTRALREDYPNGIELFSDNGYL